MPRKARIDAPGALHHVIIRGIERRKNFLKRLQKLIPDTQTDCFAWALIPNHAHLLLRSIGGWTVLKGLRKAGIRVKGDECILGDSDRVANQIIYLIDGLYCNGSNLSLLQVLRQSV